jgi:hypothetical protein
MILFGLICWLIGLLTGLEAGPVATPAADERTTHPNQQTASIQPQKDVS